MERFMFYASATQTPLGYMRAICTDKGLCQLDWQQTPFQSDASYRTESAVSRETIHQITGYFSQQVRAFDLPLDLSSNSPALQSWLTVLLNVPYGQTISYADFAERWGNRGAARAAGDACRRNPVPIIIPCHRILKADGRYDNYSGGDNKHPRDPENIKRKQWLIQLEQKQS
jgi:methylated-DNA-[protein]-cysteine S-methyltransferase